MIVKTALFFYAGGVDNNLSLSYLCLMERLDKILSQSGVCTRREVRELVRKKRVCVNGKEAVSADEKISSSDIITVDGGEVETLHSVTAVMNKSSGYVTSTSDPKSKTVMDLLPERYRRLGLYPVGRLDKDTTGLLIFTNDGALAHHLLSPKREVEKEYLVTHTGTLTDEIIEKFKEGLILPDGARCRSALLKRAGEHQSLIVITEGKYHQVKRMMGCVGLSVTALERVREGSITLSGLGRGETRELSEDEIKSLLD